MTKKYHPDISKNNSSQHFAEIRKTYENILEDLENPVKKFENK